MLLWLRAADAWGLGTRGMTGLMSMEDESNELLGITDEELVSVIPLGFADQAPPG